MLQHTSDRVGAAAAWGHRVGAGVPVRGPGDRVGRLERQVWVLLPVHHSGPSWHTGSERSVHAAVIFVCSRPAQAVRSASVAAPSSASRHVCVCGVWCVCVWHRYAAKVFPDVWEPVSTLMSCNPKCGDSDMVYWQGHWYLFVGTNNRQQGMGHQRTLYFADSVRGPFKKHPSSPLRIVGKSFGRGAGRMVTWGDHYIVRYSQHYVNGEHRYGDYVVASVITELSPTSIKIKYSKDWVINTPLKVACASGWPPACVSCR